MNDQKAARRPYARPPGTPRLLAALAAAALLAACGGGGGGSSPGIYVSATSLDSAEGGAGVTFDVRLNTAPTGDVMLSICTLDDTEGLLREAGDTFSSGCVYPYFTPDDFDLAQTITVMPVNDAVADGNQTFTVEVAVYGTLDPDYENVPVRTLSVTNADDDIPGVTVSKNSVATSEGGTTESFTVVLNTPPSATVTVPVSSTDASEALLRGGSSPSTSVQTLNLTFTASNWNSAQTVTVYGQNDLVDDGNQTFNVTVGPATGAAEYAALAQKTVAVTNSDDDAAGITVAASPVPLVTSENETTATFTVRLNTQPVGNVVVTVTSGDVAEGLLSAGAENLLETIHLTFTSSDWATPQTVTVTGQDEVSTQVQGDNVTYSVTVGPATGDAPYASLATQAVSVQNTDNDAAGLIVPAAAVGLQTSETGASNTATFTVVLNKQPATNVVVPVTVGDVTEGLVMGGSSPSVPVATLNLTFTPADFLTPQTVTVKGQVDNVVDGNQAYAITVGPPTGDAEYAALGSRSVGVTNADTDVAGFTVSKTSLTTTEGGAVNTFTVVLNRAPTADVVIPVSTSNAAEAKLSGGDSGGAYVASLNLTFTTVNWQTAQTVSVQGQVDDIDDGDKSYTITVGPTDSTSAPYDGLAARTVAGTNTDVDTAGFTVTPQTGHGVTEASTTSTFTVRLNSKPLATVTVPVTTTDATEALVSSTGSSSPANTLSLYFTASDWNVPQTVTITGVNDVAADGVVAWTLSVGPTSSGDTKYASVAAKTVSGVTRDDDATNQGSAIAPVDITGLLPYGSQVGSGSSYYRLSGLTASSSYTLRLSGVLGDVSLYVYSASDFTGQLCASTTGGDNATESCTFTVPGTGTVYVRVAAAGVTTGAVFTIEQGPPTESEPNDTIATADGPFSGDVVVTGALPTSGELDYYAVANTSGTTASVTFRTYTGSVGSCSYDTVIEIYSAAGTMLSSDDDSGVNACSQLTYSIPAGTTYYLKVRGFSGQIIPGYILQIDFP